MNDEQKRTFDVLETLRTAAWTSFDQRRDAEWKVTLTLWTGLSALIGILFTSKDVQFALSRLYLRIGCGVVVALIIVLHYSFVKGLQNANRYDRDLAECYDDFLEHQYLAKEFPLLIETPEWKRLSITRKKRKTKAFGRATRTGSSCA